MGFVVDEVAKGGRKVDGKVAEDDAEDDRKNMVDNILGFFKDLGKK